MSRHDTLYSIFTTQSTRWISEQLSSISLWGYFFFKNFIYFPFISGLNIAPPHLASLVLRTGTSLLKY